MPNEGRPAWGLLGPTRDRVRPARGLRGLTREKLRPAGGLHRCFREKVRPAGYRTPFMGHFSCAGRTFSRSHPPPDQAGRTLYRTRGRCRYKTLPARSPAAAPGTKLSRLAASASPTGTKLSQHARNTHFRRILRQQGEFCIAFTTNRPHRANKVTHQHAPRPTNAPLPQFRMQFDCMKLQQCSETLQFQHHKFIV